MSPTRAAARRTALLLAVLAFPVTSRAQDHTYYGACTISHADGDHRITWFSDVFVIPPADVDSNAPRRASGLEIGRARANFEHFVRAAGEGVDPSDRARCTQTRDDPAYIRPPVFGTESSPSGLLFDHRGVALPANWWTLDVARPAQKPVVAETPTPHPATSPARGFLTIEARQVSARQVTTLSQQARKDPEVSRLVELQRQKRVAPRNGRVLRGFSARTCAQARLAATNGAGTSKGTKFEETKAEVQPGLNVCVVQGYWTPGATGTASRQ